MRSLVHAVASRAAFSTTTTAPVVAKAPAHCPMAPIAVHVGDSQCGSNPAKSNRDVTGDLMRSPRLITPTIMLPPERRFWDQVL